MRSVKHEFFNSKKAACYSLKHITQLVSSAIAVSDSAQASTHSRQRKVEMGCGGGVAWSRLMIYYIFKTVIKYKHHDYITFFARLLLRKINSQTDFYVDFTYPESLPQTSSV